MYTPSQRFGSFRQASKLCRKDPRSCNYVLSFMLCYVKKSCNERYLPKPYEPSEITVYCLFLIFTVL